MCVYLALLLNQALVSNLVTVYQVCFYFIKRPMSFQYENPVDRVVRLRPKPDLGHRILISDFIPSAFVISNCIRPIHSSDRKVIIWSSLSDCTIICIMWMSQCGGTGLYFTELSEVSGPGIDVVPNLSKCPVPLLMLYRTYHSVWYRYWCSHELTEVSGTGMKVCTGTGDTGIHVVMTLSVRYGYWRRTELPEVSCTGNTGGMPR